MPRAQRASVDVSVSSVPSGVLVTREQPSLDVEGRLRSSAIDRSATAVAVKALNMMMLIADSKRWMHV